MAAIEAGRGATLKTIVFGFSAKAAACDAA
jgi:hypothetical protein